MMEGEMFEKGEKSPPVAFLMDKFPELGPQLCYEILSQVGGDIKKAMEILGVQFDEDEESLLAAQLASLSVTSFDSHLTHLTPKPLSKSKSKSPVNFNVNSPSPAAPPPSPSHQEEEWTVTGPKKRKNNSRPKSAEPEENSSVPSKWNRYDPSTRSYRSGSKRDFVKGLKQYLEFAHVKKVLCVISPLISPVEFKTLVILRGFPGSGKSYLASILYDASANGAVLAADDYFLHGNEYRFNPKLLPSAHDGCRERCEIEMRKATALIVIDNTNTQLWEFVGYVKLALQFDYYVQILEPETSWKENLTVLAEKNVHGVPKDAIRRMLQRYERVSLQAVLMEASGGKIDSQPQEELGIKKYESVNQKFQVDNQPVPKSPSWKRIFGSAEASPDKSMMSSKVEEASTPTTKNKMRTRTEEEINEEAMSFVNELKAALQGDDEPRKPPTPNFKGSRNSLNSSPIAGVKFDDSDDEPTDRLVLGDRRQNQSPRGNYNPMAGGSLFELKNNDFESNYWSQITKDDKKNERDKSDRFDKNEKFDKTRELGATALDFEDFEDELLDAESLGAVGGAVGGQRTFRPVDEDLEVQFDEDEDRRVITPDINYFDDGAIGGEFSSSFEHLSKLFPLVPRPELTEIFSKCNGDLNWSMDILLENGYAMDDTVNIIPPHLNTQPIDSPSAAAYQKKCVKFSENFITHPSHEEFPDLSAELPGFDSPAVAGPSRKIAPPNQSFLTGQKDDELFEAIDGADWFNLDISKDLVTDLLNSYSNPFPSLDFNSLSCSQRRIKVPPKLGFKIYKLFILNILQKMMDGWEDASNEEDNSVQVYAPYENFGRSEEEKRSIEETLIKDELYAFQLSISPPDLNKIMELETRLNALESEKAAQRRSEIQMTLAKKLSLGKLKSGFPALHEKNVEEIFYRNGGKYDVSLRQLIAMHKDYYVPEAISDTFFGANIIMKEAIDKELNALTESTSEYTEKYHDVEDMQHYELRLRAMRHSDLKKQYEVKSYESLKSSLPGVASYYSQMAKLHGEKMREANRLAAKRLYGDYMRKNPDSTTLDLHFFYVTEAIDITQYFLWSKYNQMIAKGQKRIDVKIITGKGNNSENGIAKIEPAIHDLLRKNNYAFVRMNGYFNVNLWLNKPPFSDYYKANDGQVRKLKTPFQ